MKQSKNGKLFEQATALVKKVNYNSEGIAAFIVWYKRNPTFNENDYPQDIEDFERDFVRLASVPAINCDQVYELMQSESWSPQGEAQQIIHGLGLSHTSMHIGDMIEDNYNDKFYMIRDLGYMTMNFKPSELKH